VSIAGEEVRRVTGAPPPDPNLPGMFAFAPPGRIEDELANAGFTDIRAEALDLRYDYESFEAWWESSRALGKPLGDAFDAMPAEQQETLVAALRERLGEYTGPGGRVEFPAKPLVAVATA
jgi:hypothetical protein